MAKTLEELIQKAKNDKSLLQNTIRKPDITPWLRGRFETMVEDVDTAIREACAHPELFEPMLKFGCGLMAIYQVVKDRRDV